ncbi:hypothetical protein V1291_001534 [Nitrobacteraceae bacterium AZCC 1564]
MSSIEKKPLKPVTEDIKDVTPTTPLRLETAAKLAFPDGSMKLAGLRREIARGRLAYEVIAGKHYTTLTDIEDMRRLCRVDARAAGARSSQRAASAFRSSSDVAFSAEDALSPQERLRALLSQRLQKRQKKKPGTSK